MVQHKDKEVHGCRWAIRSSCWCACARVGCSVFVVWCLVFGVWCVCVVCGMAFVRSDACSDIRCGSFKRQCKTQWSFQSVPLRAPRQRRASSMWVQSSIEWNKKIVLFFADFMAMFFFHFRICSQFCVGSLQCTQTLLVEFTMDDQDNWSTVSRRKARNNRVAKKNLIESAALAQQVRRPLPFFMHNIQIVPCAHAKTPATHVSALARTRTCTRTRIPRKS